MHIANLNVMFSNTTKTRPCFFSYVEQSLMLQNCNMLIWFLCIRKRNVSFSKYYSLLNLNSNRVSNTNWRGVCT